MPRHYPLGRTCQATDCESELTRTQAKYCSVDCSNRSQPGHRRPKAEIIAALPTDDEIWDMRDRVRWSDIATESGVSLGAAVRQIRARGWDRTSHCKRGGVAKAPCKVCGRSTDSAHLSPERVCVTCAESRAQGALEAVKLFRREFRRRQKGGDRYNAMHRTAPCRFRIDGIAVRPNRWAEKMA